MQYTAIFLGCKIDNFQMNDCDIFAQNIEGASTHEQCNRAKIRKCIIIPVLLYKNGV